MINKMLSRTSIRSFEDKKIDDETIKQLSQVVNSAPTSMNGQIFSCVFVTDKNKLKFIKELMDKNMPSNSVDRSFVYHASLLAIFCIDLNRLEYACAKNNLKPVLGGLDLLATASGDAYIGATMLMDASISLGLGTCFLGSIKGITNDLKQLLKLDGNIFPIVGLLIGYPNEINDIKPKMNKVYFEEYSLIDIKNEVDKYDTIFSNYLLKRNSLNKNDNWSKPYSLIMSNNNVYKVLENNFKNWVKFN